MPSDTFSIPNYLTTDYADARLWVLPDISCAIGALCDEHNVVHEDLKGCEENTGKMAMRANKTWRFWQHRATLICKVMNIRITRES